MSDDIEDIVVRLRRTRADMIGTDDEEHYFDCHEAAHVIEELRGDIQVLKLQRDATHVSRCPNCGDGGALARADARCVKLTDEITNLNELAKDRYCTMQTEIERLRAALVAIRDHLRQSRTALEDDDDDS